MRRIRLDPTALVIAALFLVTTCGDPPPAPAPLAVRPAAPVAPAPPPELVPRAPVPEPAAEEAAPPTEPETAASRVVSEKWYAMMQDGQRSGWLHVVWTTSTHEGRPTIHDRTERSSTQTRRMGPMSDVFEVTSVSDLERTPDGLLLHLRSVTREPGRETVVEQRWTGTGYELSSTAAGASETRRVPCDAPLPVDGEAFLAQRIAAGDVRVGDELSYQVPNFGGERLDTIDVEVLGREVLTLPSGTEDCLHVRETRRGVPTATEMWLDGEGVVRQYESGGVTLLHTTERRARDVPVGGVSYSITLECEPYVPRATSFDQAVVELHFGRRGSGAAPELPDLPDTPFSKVLERDEDSIRVALTAHDDPSATVALPVEDEDLARWLRPTLLECSEHPSVAAAARQAVGGEKDGRAVARKLLRYVFRTLEKASGPVASPNAAEILRDRAGDCSEHAVLFVALCRAAGLPARRHSGYALVGHHWGSHSFCEVWLGKWVGADPTTNELGTRARYVAFGQVDDPDAFPGIVSQRMRGCTSIEVESFEDAGETVDVAAATRSRDKSALSGLSLAEPPDGWRASLHGRTGSAAIAGKGVQVDVNISAGMGDIPADLIAEMLFSSPDAVAKLGDHEAAILRLGSEMGRSLIVAVPYRRRMLMLNVRLDAGVDADEVLATLANILAPTLTTD